MKLAAVLGFAAVLALTATASAQIEPFLSGNVVKIGVLTDMSSIYADIGGPGSVEAARMAIADFGGTVNGKKIELVSADHQNKPDLGAAIANQWFGNRRCRRDRRRGDFECGPRRPGGRAQQE